MRLGYLVPEFPSQTHIFFWKEITELRRLGVEVFVISTRRPPIDECKHEFALVARKETKYLFPPSVQSILLWVGKGLTNGSAAADYLRSLQGGARAQSRHLGFLACAIDLFRWAEINHLDHIHGHSCADAAHILALTRRLGGPPFSLTLHGDLDVYGTDHKEKFSEAAFVSAVGQHLCQQIVERTDLEKFRVRTTFMGIETSRFASLGSARKHRSNALQLATVARLHQNKGHLHALSAVRQARDLGIDATYSIAGEGPFREVIQTKITELGLNGSVKLLGTVSENEVLKILSNADAFLLTSVGTGEAWPVAVMEAMGSGLPVVSSIIGATPEMIVSGVDGFLVSQKDEPAIRDRIVTLAQDTTLRTRMGAAARNTALKRFDVAVSAGELRRSIYAVRPIAPA